MTQEVQGRFDLIPTQLAMAAMRDNGYKNAAYALAELIDNSIQAGATHVEVLCSEREVMLTQRSRQRIDQIGVLDNGSGMDADTLRIALQFGNGTRLADRSGMGRFGMGLPNASISQCRKVEVWTWQSGIDSAVYSYIDLDEVDQGSMSEVPMPNMKTPPLMWVNAAAVTPGVSGTLVVWSVLDRCVWMTGRTIIEHSEFLVGRIYRRFLADERATIRMASFGDRRPHEATLDRYAKPNDPIYRMTPSSTPEPFSERPMFDTYGHEWEYSMDFDYHGETHKVVARFTVASEEARRRSATGVDAGNLPHGQHARRNVGISVVRADREIELSQALVDPSEARDRWWGIEIDFPPALDDIFGVTNNKQSARTLSEMLDTPLENLLEEGQSPQEFYDQLLQDEDPRYGLIRFSARVRENLRLVRNAIQAQMRGQTRRSRHSPDSAERRGTAATRQLQAEGFGGGSDLEEQLPAAERERELEAEIEKTGVLQGDAHDLAHDVIESDLKYLFVAEPLDSPAFFSVTPRAGAIMVRLNSAHPVYEHVMEVLEQDGDGSAEDRLANAREGIRLLLEAWARYEDEQPEGPRRDAALDARNDWGRVARRFFQT